MSPANERQGQIARDASGDDTRKRRLAEHPFVLEFHPLGNYIQKHANLSDLLNSSQDATTVYCDSSDVQNGDSIQNQFVY